MTIESTDTGTQALSHSEAVEAISSLMGDSDEVETTEEESIEHDGQDDLADDDAEYELDDEDGESEQEQPTDELFEVKVNGQVEKVTKDELIAGYQKDAYFRQATAELANDKRQVQAERQQYSEGLEELSKATEFVVALAQKFAPQKPDIDAYYNYDPSGREYHRAMQQYGEQMAELEKLSSMQDAAKDNKGYLNGKSREDFIAEQDRLLLEMIPEWKADAEKAKAEFNETIEYALKSGYRKEALRNFDALTVKHIRDSMKYQKILAKKQTARQAATEKPPVIKRGKPSNTAKGSAFDRLKKTGSKRDGMAAIMNLI